MCTKIPIFDNNSGDIYYCEKIEAASSIGLPWNNEIILVSDTLECSFDFFLLSFFSVIMGHGNGDVTTVAY